MLKTLTEKFPPEWFLKKKFEKRWINCRPLVDFIPQLFLFSCTNFLWKIGPRKTRPPKISSYPVIKHTPVKIVKHGAYQVETSVSTQLTPPNLIVHTLDADPPRSPSQRVAP